MAKISVTPILSTSPFRKNLKKRFEKAVQAGLDELVTELAFEIINSEVIERSKADKMFLGFYGFGERTGGIKFATEVRLLAIKIIARSKESIRIVRNKDGFTIRIFGRDFFRNLYRDTPFVWDASLSWLRLLEQGDYPAFAKTQNGFIFITRESVSKAQEKSKAGKKGKKRSLLRLFRESSRSGQGLMLEETNKTRKFSDSFKIVPTRIISKAITKVFTSKKINKVMQQQIKEAGLLS